MDLLEEPIDILATHDVITIYDSDSIGYAILKMINNRLRRLPVVDDEEQMVGILTSTDILKALEKAKAKNILEQKVRDYMNNEVIYVSRTTSIRDAMVTMYTNGISGVPIVDGGSIIGIFTNKDILLSTVIWREIDNVNIMDGGPAHEIVDDDLIHESYTIRETVIKLVETGKKHLLVQNDEGAIIGAISVKNILRTLVSVLILQGTELHQLDDKTLTKVVKDPLMRKKENSTLTDMRNWMIARSTEIVPIVDEQGAIEGLVTEIDMVNYLIEQLGIVSDDGDGEI